VARESLTAAEREESRVQLEVNGTRLRGAHWRVIDEFVATASTR
jgi:hypothetical protein